MGFSSLLFSSLLNATVDCNALLCCSVALQTHTMQGSGTGSMRGIIPRAMQQVGQYKNELEAKGWEYYMEVSFVEIYNEDIRDLLRSGQHEPGRHEIKKDAQGKLYISDVTLIAVDPNDVTHVEK